MIDAASKFDPEIESILQLQFKLLDLSLDVERNRDDGQFRQDFERGAPNSSPDKIFMHEKTDAITYVFDANVFEIFINPKDVRGELASLHARHWRISEDSAMEWTKLREITAQTAILTAEYQFSEAFRIRAGDKIFLTEWHYSELMRRVVEMSTRYGTELQTTPPEAPEKRFKVFKEAKALLDKAATVADLNLRELDPLLDSDVKDIARLQLLDPGDVDPFIYNRLALHVLANEQNDTIERVEQLDRILSKGIAESLTLIGDRFFPNEAESEEIKKAVSGDDGWFSRLEDEIKLQATQQPAANSREFESEDFRPRSRRALLDDAKSIAFMQWASKVAAKAGERLVFVTADELLFDAYRRWYANLKPTHADYDAPFFMRRYAQFSPIFNMSDSDNALGGNVRSYFEQLRNVIEITLLPVNLARQSHDRDRQNVVTRMRELTALSRKEVVPISMRKSYKALTKVIKDQDAKAVKRQLEGLLADWRLIERATLGLSANYVRARLSQMERALPELHSNDIGNFKNAFQNYVSEKIQNLYVNTLHFCLPLARSFISEWKPKTVGPPRAPIAFSLKLKLSSGEFDLGEKLMSALEQPSSGPLFNDEQWTALEQKADYIFVVAAWLSLAAEDWGEAARYAELALMACKTAKGGQAQQMDDDLAEIYYLCAMTKRFQMGATGTARNRDVWRKLRTIHREAQAYLDMCGSYHAERSELLQHFLRDLRARSERAALNLFMAAAMSSSVIGFGALAVTVSEQVSVKDQQRRAAEYAWNAAFTDLTACLDKTSSMRKSGVSGTHISERISQQLTVNFAAAVVLHSLLGLFTPIVHLLDTYGLRETLKELKTSFASEDMQTRPLLRLEILACLYIADDADAGNEGRGMRKTDKFSLALDADLFRAIRAEIFA